MPTFKEPVQEAPCKSACPAGIDVPRYVRAIAAGQFDESLAVIREKIPFPSVCGRVCVHPCEGECNGNWQDNPIQIRALKEFVAERSGALTKEPPTTKSTGKTVAIVGSGPAGLTAAYYLAKLGHAVTVFESKSKSGGMMRWGIPAYDLPEEILDRDIDNILGQGVELKLNTRVDSVNDLLNGDFDAAFIAPGLAEGLTLNIPGADLKGVMIGVQLLHDINAGKKVKLGSRVLVLGGGGVAFDAARSAVRLGAKEVHLACIESRNSIPARPEVVAEAEQEGVVIHPSLSFGRIEGEGQVTGVECLNLRWMKYDDEGGLHMEAIPGSEHVLKADTVIFAVGQGVDLGLVADTPQVYVTQRTTLLVDEETMATGQRGVFAGGDAVNGPSSVIAAIDTGRKAAMAIDKYLGGDGEIDVAMAPPEGEVVQTELQGFPVGARVEVPTVPVEERLKGFAGVEVGFTEEEAVNEAKRCLRCDLPITVEVENCVSCLTCVMRCALKYGNAFSPARSNIKVYPITEHDNIIEFTDDCDTCGICARYCPHDALYRGERRLAEVAEEAKK